MSEEEVKPLVELFKKMSAEDQTQVMVLILQFFDPIAKAINNFLDTVMVYLKNLTQVYEIMWREYIKHQCPAYLKEPCKYPKCHECEYMKDVLEKTKVGG